MYADLPRSSASPSSRERLNQGMSGRNVRPSLPACRRWASRGGKTCATPLLRRPLCDPRDLETRARAASARVTCDDAARRRVLRRRRRKRKRRRRRLRYRQHLPRRRLWVRLVSPSWWRQTRHPRQPWSPLPPCFFCCDDGSDLFCFFFVGVVLMCPLATLCAA